MAHSFATAHMPSFLASDGGRAAAGFPSQQTGDCVARAIAHATGGPYGPIWYALAFLEESPGKAYMTADNGISPDDMADYLTGLGFERFRPAYPCFADELPELRTGRWLIYTKAHMSACVNGVWLDTWDSRQRVIYRLWKLKGA